MEPVWTRTLETTYVSHYLSSQLVSAQTTLARSGGDETKETYPSFSGQPGTVEPLVSRGALSKLAAIQSRVVVDRELDRVEAIFRWHGRHGRRDFEQQEQFPPEHRDTERLVDPATFVGGTDNFAQEGWRGKTQLEDNPNLRSTAETQGTPSL
ncbi:hypothetical protein VTO42DRAFT_3799 [Malbranchea cinnamomea]